MPKTFRDTSLCSAVGRTLATVTVLGLVVGSTPRAAEPTTVHVTGTVSWQTPWPATEVFVSVFQTAVAVNIAPDGKSGTYDLAVPSLAGLLQLFVEIRHCSSFPCPNTLTERGDILQFVGGYADVDLTNLVVDLAMPANYAFQSVTGQVSVNGGGTITSGFIQLRSFDSGTGVQHSTFSPLSISGGGWALDVLVGVGLVDEVGYVSVAECPATDVWWATRYEVSASTPVVHDQTVDARIADAGFDQVVDEGSAVMLDGSFSRCARGYAWTQIAGPDVTLSDLNSATPSFTAPVLTASSQETQTLTFQLVVDHFGISSADTVDVSVRRANHAPVADAGADQAVTEGSLVSLNALLSYDPDGDSIASYQWTQIAGPTITLVNGNTAQASFTAPLLPGGGGTATNVVFALAISDGSLSAIDEVRVSIEQVNHPPTANAGSDQTVTEGSQAILDGTASRDPDGDPLTYSWRQTTGPLVELSNSLSSMPTFTAPLVGASGARLVFDLDVSDGAAGSTGRVTITVRRDIDPPACQLARPSVALLWPPDHKLITIKILGVTAENSDLIITTTRVTQDEPVQGVSNGDTSPDAVPQGNGILLRAERAASGNGRVYEVSFEARDQWGGSCTGSVRVGVPPNMKPGTIVVDDGQQYDAMGR
jgi:hypothetical protein